MPEGRRGVQGRMEPVPSTAGYLIASVSPLRMSECPRRYFALGRSQCQEDREVTCLSPLYS